MARRAREPQYAALEPLPSDLLPEEMELAELVKQFPLATRVTIVRYNKASDRWAHLATVPADVFNEDLIQLRWGGGLYQARFRNARGQIVHTVSAIEIEDDPDRPALAAPDVAPVPPVGNGAAADPNNMFMGMILSELKSNREMMLEMVRGFADRQPAAQSDLVGMVTALGALQGLLPKPSTPLPEKIVERILDGAMNGRGDAAPQNEWVGLLKDVLVEFKPAINLALRQQLPAALPRPAAIETAAAAAPAAALPAAEEVEDVDATQNAIDWLKQQHANGAKPEELAPIALHFTDKQQIDLLLAKTNEQIFAEINDEQLGEPGLRSWFEALFGELRAIRNIPDPSRTTGDQVNAHEDGRTG